MLISLLLATALSAAPPATDSLPLRPDSEIRLTVLRNAASIRNCYEKEGLRRDPRVSGRIDLELTILPTGVVERAQITAMSLRGGGSVEVALCVSTIARNWRFERGRFAVDTVVFPLLFDPAPARSRISDNQ